MAIGAVTIANWNSGLLGSAYVADMSNLPERLREAMEAVEIDQPTLAARVGCTQGAISQILLGNTQRSRFLPEIADALGVTIKWLKGEETREGRAVAAAASPNEIAKEMGWASVPWLELGYSMGGGSVVQDYRHLGFMPFQREWLKSMMAGSFDDLFVARGDGDSMEPTLKDGDIVLIDRAQRDIRQQDRIWAVSYGDLGVIKRVRRMPGGTYQLLSDNPSVTPIPVADDEMYVVGRVIWIGRRI